MIYLDNAATTKPCKDAVEAQNYANEFFFNPSALYLPAVKIETQINKVRQKILNKLNLTSSHNAIFTSGATEANNLALFQATRFKGKTILVSEGEHPAVYNYAKNCEGMNFATINLTPSGEVDLEDLKNKLSNNVALVSVMQVSNETGAINNLAEVSKIVKNFSPSIMLHCDAVQGFCKIEERLPSTIDFITISSHKIHGLKGTGALIYKTTQNIKPLLKGGGQESDLRSGTQNVGGILALGAAIDHDTGLEAVKKLSAYTRQILSQKITGVLLNGEGSPYIINFSIDYARSETIVRLLEEENIYVSNGSACSSRHADNRTLAAMGTAKKFIEGTIRISFCKENSKEEIDIFADKLAKILKENKK